MLTFIYAVMNFLAEGICGLAMYGWLGDSANRILLFLIFNFCAFVLQLPAGALTDGIAAVSRPELRGRKYARAAYVGVILIVTGAWFSPAILGLGNALFQVGACAGTILEDREKQYRGAALGIFMAPGALGLYIGKACGAGQMREQVQNIVIIACVAIAICCIVMEIIMQVMEHRFHRQESGSAEIPDFEPWKEKTHKSSFWNEEAWLQEAPSENKSLHFQQLKDRYHGKKKEETLPAAEVLTPEEKQRRIVTAFFCFAAVILKSWMETEISFPWSNGVTLGLMAAAAVMVGRILGSLALAKFGFLRTTFFSLLSAAAFFSIGEYALAGLIALAAFHMVMPVILYLLTERFTNLPGFSVGLLSLAVFLGFLPVWFNLQLPDGWLTSSASLTGAICCLFLLALMMLAGTAADNE